MPKRGRRTSDPARDAEEARVVLVLALLSAAGPFLVLGLRPLLVPSAALGLAGWEKAVLVGTTPLFALMSLALFARSSGARARPQARAGAVLAATTLLLAVASAVAIGLAAR